MVHVCVSLCCPLLCVAQMIAVSQPHVVRCFIRNQSGLSRLFAHYTVRLADFPVYISLSSLPWTLEALLVRGMLFLCPLIVQCL